MTDQHVRGWMAWPPIPDAETREVELRFQEPFGEVPTLSIMLSLPLDGKLDGKEMTIETCMWCKSLSRVDSGIRVSCNFCRW